MSLRRELEFTDGPFTEDFELPERTVSTRPDPFFVGD